MKSLTIHGMDEHLSRKIEEKARAEGLSLNKAVKKLLAEALGMEDDHIQQRRRRFQEFCGVWKEKEVREFDKSVADMESVHPEDWR